MSVFRIVLCLVSVLTRIYLIQFRSVHLEIFFHSRNKGIVEVLVVSFGQQVTPLRHVGHFHTERSKLGSCQLMVNLFRDGDLLVDPVHETHESHDNCIKLHNKAAFSFGGGGFPPHHLSDLRPECHGLSEAQNNLRNEMY